MGKLIVLEGLDGSGKSTQLELLLAGLQKRGIDCKSFSFPDYASEASAPLRMYLSGAFGDKPDAVNPYAAAAFFSIDRYASYKQHWETYYQNGGNVIVGRYTTSNAIHQTSKLPPEQWEDYLAWLYDFEYRKMGIPQPDLVLFLDMPVAVSQKLLNGRYHGDEKKKTFTSGTWPIWKTAAKLRGIPLLTPAGRPFAARKGTSPAPLATSRMNCCKELSTH